MEMERGDKSRSPNETEGIVAGVELDTGMSASCKKALAVFGKELLIKKS